MKTESDRKRIRKILVSSIKKISYAMSNALRNEINVDYISSSALWIASIVDNIKIRLL